jgi:hypothetical protein
VCGANNTEDWRVRHAICLFGLEDLHRLVHRPELAANKFWPEWDYGAFSCWMEWLYNRTHQLAPVPLVWGGNASEGELGGLREEFYANLPYVRFNRLSEGEREAVRTGEADFNCSMPRLDVCGWKGR